MLASLAIAPLNHLLHGESWARKRLQSCSGKTARFRLSPFIDVALTVKASGEVSTAASNARDDVILTIDPVLLPRLLARDEDAFRNIRIRRQRIRRRASPCRQTSALGFQGRPERDIG